MSMSDAAFSKLIFKTFGQQRFTQDSPILPDVWMEYWRNPDQSQDLLIVPLSGKLPGETAQRIQGMLGKANEAGVAYHHTSVVAELSFAALVQRILPLTGWWQGRVRQQNSLIDEDTYELAGLYLLIGLVLIPDRERAGELAERFLEEDESESDIEEVAAAAAKLPISKDEDSALIWMVNRNRPAELAVNESRKAIKADAAEVLFQVSCGELAWAVIDSGIDANHPSFFRGDDGDDQWWMHPAGEIASRVVATYDFTLLRELMTKGSDELSPEQKKDLKDLRKRVSLGREIDWELILPLIEIRHTTESYRAPRHPHGTHVAGILAGCSVSEEAEDPEYVGISRDLKLYDFRVFDDDGRGDEFTIMAALQVVAFLNRNRDNAVINGVNLSLSLRHQVTNFACGRTPICEECERLVGDGVVVVAAAGNKGYQTFLTDGGSFDGYHDISITDPGNAESVITVGATHRSRPHSYGVSYFSSRGPTGDGRMKPDLVAPGEKIQGPIPGLEFEVMDGTSMAAPHVSGAAALLMARHRELVGQPVRIKEILCGSATDLGRERNFQGAGMVDVLRALQSV